MSAISFSHGKVARSTSGMALIAVLWIVAALSILITGSIAAVRGETRTVTSARQLVEARAAGDAAIQQALQQLAAQKEAVTRQVTGPVMFRGATIPVQVTPLNGFIDINRAPPSLLVAMLETALKMPPDAAAALTGLIVAQRTPAEGQPRPQGFEAVEDLLRLPGVDYDLYATISPLLTADQPASGKVNPYAAPVEVLLVLTRGDAATAMRIAAARDAGQQGIDTSAINPEFIDNSTTKRFRLQALVPLSDGRAAVISRHVGLEPSVDDGLPWRTFKTEQRIQVPRP